MPLSIFVLFRFDYLIKIENVIFILFIKHHNCVAWVVIKEIKCRFDAKSGPAAHVASPDARFLQKFMSTPGAGLEEVKGRESA